MKKFLPILPSYLCLSFAIAIIALAAFYSVSEKSSSFNLISIANAQTGCEEDPYAEGCPCTGPDEVGVQPNCVCYNETNPACVNYSYCAEYPQSDQCNQTCSNQTYHDAHISECGTCGDLAYKDAHPEECADPVYCCDACSSGSPSYQHSNYEPTPSNLLYCQPSSCVQSVNQCVESISGCTDSSAANYNSSANSDDGSCYWNDSCSVEQEFNVNYEGVNPAVPYYGTYTIQHTWNSWPVQPDASLCAQLAASGDSDQYIKDNAPSLDVGSSCGTDCTILNISHGDECPEGQVRNDSNVCVDAETECANNGGVWVSADQTCNFPEASCGSAANGTPTANPPESNLCELGTASSIMTNTNTFDWTCTSSDNLLTVSCSTPRESEEEGSGYSEAGCGFADGTPTASEPTELLCAEGNHLLLPNGVSLAANVYSWTCVDDNTDNPSSCSAAQISPCEGTDVMCQGNCVPPGTCACPSCSGTASTTLITSFTIEPRLVASSTVPCYIDWSAGIPKDEEDHDIGGCAINGQYVVASSTSPAPYPPTGVYTLFCQTGTEFQSRVGRCGVNPSIQER